MNIKCRRSKNNEYPKDGGADHHKKYKRYDAESEKNSGACAVNDGGYFKCEDEEKFYRYIYVNGWPEYVLQKNSCFRKYNIVRHNQKPTLSNQIVPILATTAFALLIIGIIYLSYCVSKKYNFGRVTVISILVITYAIFLKLSDNKIDDPLFRVLESAIIVALLSSRLD